jgi:hypothetical protein
VFVFALKSDGTPDKHTILYQATRVATTLNQWCEHELSAPVEAPDGFYIGISPNGGTGFLSLGMDEPSEEYPFMYGTHWFNINYYGQYSVEFRTFESALFEQSPMIRAEGMSMGKAAEPARFKGVARSGNASSPANASELPVLVPATAPVQTVPLATSKALPVPVGYSVYRLVEDTPEASWSMLTEVDGNVTSYTDTQWATLPANAYRYAVKVEYAGNNISNAALTNMVAKDMTAVVTVNITTNSDDPANGTIVTFASQNNPYHTYTTTANSGTVILPKVWKGETYNVSVALEGFNLHTATMEITGDVTLDVELIETIVTPFGLKVEPTENPAEWMFGWNTWTTQKLAYWNPDYSLFTIFQDANKAYGVIYDLTDYPNSILQHIDFHHAAWGKPGTWNYIVHVMDMDAKQIVYSSGQLSTTGNDKWEENLDLNQIESLGGKRVGIFVEPLGNTAIDAYPSLSADGVSVNAHSYILNIATMEASLIHASQGNFGEYLMNLYIYTAEGKRVKVSNNAKLLTGYDVYLNDSKITTTPDVQHLFTALTEGTHRAGVKAVFVTGSSDIVYSDEFTVSIPKYTVTFNVVDAEDKPVTDATVVFNGETLAGYIAEGVTAGTYEYSVSKEGYETATGTVEVIDGNVTKSVVLAAVGISGNTLTNITVYGNKNSVHIANPHSISLKSVQIADVLGRVVYDGRGRTFSTPAEAIPVNGTSGIYVVRIVSDDNRVLSTKVRLNN